jgi:hypothetical protein
MRVVCLCPGTGTTPGDESETKGREFMGDKSPKSVHKKTAQKQLKTDAASQKKKQAAEAKQIAAKK